MARVQRVLIVGGGIAGLSAAIGLRKAGISVDIVEIKKEWTVYHVGIIVLSNFIRAMVALGIADRCVAIGFPYEGLRFYDAQGNLLGDVPGTKLAGPSYPACLGMARPAPHNVLSETAMEAGARVRLGLNVSKFIQSEDKVTVKFTDGTAGDYDLAVGADGVHSQIRSMVFGDQLKPKLTGQGVWRYGVPRPKDLDWCILYDGKKRGKAGVVPLTRDTAYLFRVLAEPRNSRFPDDKLHELLRERLRGFGGVIATIRDNYITDPTKAVYRPLEAFLMPPPWYRGRVLLIGDAAHATTPHLGQGAAQAVEGAVVLAELLAKDAPVRELLDAFMKRRYERNKFVVESSVQIGEWEQHPTPDADFIGLTAKSGEVTAQPL
jgi:2-polyprenyl-6-methoxyphenol hydroxylase-like FAD-dependent oxidoreductase